MYCLISRPIYGPYSLNLFLMRMSIYPDNKSGRKVSEQSNSFDSLFSSLYGEGTAVVFLLKISFPAIVCYNSIIELFSLFG